MNYFSIYLVGELHSKYLKTYAHDIYFRTYINIYANKHKIKLSLNYYNYSNYISDVSIFHYKIHALTLNSCNNVTNVDLLNHIHCLYLLNCINITNINNLYCVHTLCLKNCVKIIDIYNLNSTYILNIINCKNIKDVGRLTKLNTLYANIYTYGLHLLQKLVILYSYVYQKMCPKTYYTINQIKKCNKYNITKNLCTKNIKIM